MLASTNVSFVLDRDLQEFVELLEGRVHCSTHCLKFVEGKWVVDDEALEAFIDGEWRWYAKTEKQKSQLEFAKHFAAFLNTLDEYETRLFFRDISHAVERPMQQVIKFGEEVHEPAPWQPAWQFVFRDLGNDPTLPREFDTRKTSILNEDRIDSIFHNSKNPGCNIPCVRVIEPGGVVRYIVISNLCQIMESTESDG